MKKLIIVYKDFILRVHSSNDNTCIIDSYKVKSIGDMKSVIQILRNEVEDTTAAINNRGIVGMINEWRVHNLLYSLNILRSRTKDVDLNLNQPWYIKMLYSLISPLYLHFF